MAKLTVPQLFFFLVFVFCACNHPVPGNSVPEKQVPGGSYAQVNGLRMYYEVYGEGEPMVLLHGGGSTINTSFGNLIPVLSRHFRLICVELQAHGRSGDRESAISFEQDADDVAVLLDSLNIGSAHVFGFSNGATSALQFAIRHPGRCQRCTSQPSYR
jgi:pimeloyl-ACP methyl ester carboxylesterase